MIKTICMGVTLSLLGLTTGCDKDDASYNTPYCVNGEGTICDPAGLPFVRFASLRSDACQSPVRGNCAMPLSATTATLTQPEAGKVCMKGTVVGKDGFAWLVLGVSRWNQHNTQIFDLLDAGALGIAALQLTVDSPPTTGLSLFATTAHQTMCLDGPPECLGEVWNLMTGPRSNLVKPIDTAGPLDAPFTNFARINPNEVLDSTRLGHFIFVVSPGDYDFCVSDFKFLDAQGNEVSPPATTDAGAP